MVDYYALPATGHKAWPMRAIAADRPMADRGAIVQEGMLNDLAQSVGDESIARRFVPFVTMHEYEALLFSDCHKFAHGIGRPDLAHAFQAVRERFASPEEINDSPVTAPSKRVKAIFPGYQKPFLGALAMMEIGLTAVRAQCPHFDAWVARLEQACPNGCAA
jgi:hypothetical protein